MFISLSGLLGAGKTTLAEKLAEILKIPIFYEPVKNNEYLSDFYLNPSKYGFAMQIYLLNKRFRQQQQIIWGGDAIQDRSIYEDSIFAKVLMRSGFMEERDYNTYIELFQQISNFMSKPNILVHLHVTPEESLRRIKMRGRDCEKDITLEYLQELSKAYDEFLEEIAHQIPVLKVDYSEFIDANKIAEMIRETFNIRLITKESISNC